ncbi:ABC transporter permease subunit [Pyrodictium abyssi]|uniref:ABC transporter permease subunit n=1 Tax=Pyrodictium abyssi TaxID=54256 RepID=UPI0030C6A8E4
MPSFWVECTSIAKPLEPPSAEHPLGTDPVGRDALCLLAIGGYGSAIAAASAVAVSLTVITLGGVLTLYPLGRSIVTIVAGAAAPLPRVALAMMLALFMRPGPVLVGAFIAMLAAPQVLRMLSTRVEQMLGQAYVEAAYALGADNIHILLRYVLPGTLDAAIGHLGLAASMAVNAEAMLSMLGLSDPTVPSWGKIVSFLLETPGALMTEAGLVQALASILVVTLYSLILYWAIRRSAVRP